ncbi:MAG: hypothetical protein N4A59_02990 [Marinifilum sp.]|jgi:hypothetical protein|nr:hypothetical protein [Marinifilum sp.]
MKKFIFSLLSIVIIGITIFSCNKTNDPEYITEKLNVSDFEYIGKMHNEGLAYSLIELQKNKSNLKSTGLYNKSSLIELQKDITINFVNKQSGSSQLKEIAIAQVKRRMNDYSHSDQELKSSRENFVPDSLMSKLSIDAKNQLLKIFEIMDDSDMDLSSLKSRVSAIEQYAIESLNVEEQFLILSTSSVAKYTLDYWSVNYEEWLKLNNEGLKNTKGIFDWKAAGKADVNGAATSALTLAVSGTGAGPAGWAGIELTVVGSGLISSACRMIWNV